MGLGGAFYASEPMVDGLEGGGDREKKGKGRKEENKKVFVCTGS